MKNSVIALVVLFLACSQAPVAAQPEHQHAAMPAATSQPQWAKDALQRSPRHREWVKLKSGNRVVNAFVVYPEVKNKATSVVAIHEIFGMSDWVQMLTDELAAAGYIAIAPDLLSGMGPHGGGTSDFTDGNAVGMAIRDLPPDQITADLNAAADYVAQLPSANGKVAVTGFCWAVARPFALPPIVRPWPRRWSFTDQGRSRPMRSLRSRRRSTAFTPAMTRGSARRFRRRRN
jgi:hypothetical protein